MLKIIIQLLVSTSLALINGKPLENEPDVVRLVFQNGWICSGVFLDPTTILTAAHCLVADDLIQLVKLKEILSDGDQPLEVKETNSFVHPSYRNQYWPSYDVGIIKTSVNANFKATFGLDSPREMRTGQAVLFGC